MDAHAASPLSPRPAFPWLKLSLHGLSLLLAAPLAYALWQNLPAFAELFASFGTELPQLSRLTIEHPQALWNILRTALANYLLWLGLWLWLRERWSSLGLLLGALATWLLIGLTLLALYLPIFTLSAVV
ncbi:hypothetical protein A9179_06730 [Pseudomonas alcaligenes]|uniref:Uncharacterized protein n=1 Tax=Aquipseudomonas alcaligenes TaxID=43263 RepID=A0ABR7RYN6_AQUAC|nr:hypothetical protein [Pseudomonas alcaligenes]MBC9249969.1 hypothetical protein [Pseudomonas alcaligenes]